MAAMMEIQIQDDFDLDETTAKSVQGSKQRTILSSMPSVLTERGIQILRQDPWETLVSFIISQNKNIPAIKNCITLLCAAAGELPTDDMGEKYAAFPSPETVLGMSEEQLRARRLGYRWNYVRSAAAKQ